MENEFGLKELYSVSIKTTQNIEMNGKTIEAGETVVAFDKVQISTFNEVRKITTANGGFDNRPHVWWETINDISFSLTQGIFSKSHFTMMVNAKLYNVASDTPIAINKREELESDANGIITLSEYPLSPLFVYDSDGNKLTYTATVGTKTLNITTPYKDVLVDYYYNYSNGYEFIRIGEELSHGYFALEGRTKVKDDITGQVKTGLLRIPKLKLVSDLSMQLGRNAGPLLGRMDAVACPVGVRGNNQVMDIIFLNDDIDSDL